MAQFIPQITKDGSYTFFSSEFNEAFHSHYGARQEAEKKFLEPSLLKDKAHWQNPRNSGSLRLLDICYGLGYNSAAALEAIRQVRQNPQLVQKLQSNTRYLRSLLAENEFTTMGETQVIPVFLPPELNPKLFASHLIENHGIWVSPIWYRAKPRLRITANALHTQEEIDHLVAAMVATRNALSKEQASQNPYILSRCGLG